jgi:hypothetical protein
MHPSVRTFDGVQIVNQEEHRDSKCTGIDADMEAVGTTI